MRLLAALLLVLLTGCTTMRDKATTAAAHDVATTAAGLAAGAAEANPLGLITIPVKIGALAYADGLPTGERETTQAAVAALWTGAAANNWCVLASIASGGTLAPACIMLGLVVALKVWEGTTMERQFWMICARERQSKPDLVCRYTTPTG